MTGRENLERLCGAAGRSGRRRWLSVHLGLCLIGLCAGAERAGAAASLALGQETTLTADRSGFVELRLGQELNLSDTEGGQPREISMKFSGTPRFAVAVLRATATDGEGRHPMVTAATERGAATTTHDWGRRLPAGDYRLYVSGTASETKLVITIPSLSGKVTTGLTDDLDIFAGELPLLRSDARGLSVFGRSVPNRGETLVFWDLTYSFGSGGGRKELCFYDSPPPEKGFGPGCPGGSSTGGTTDPGRVTTSGGSSGGLRFRGDFAGFGGNFTSASGEPPTVDFHAAWLPLSQWDELAESPRETAPAPGAVQVRRTAGTRRGRARVQLRCPSAGAPCRGSLRFGRARPTSFDLAPGRRATLPVRLPPELRRLERSRYARLTISAEPATRRRVRIRLLPRAR